MYSRDFTKQIISCEKRNFKKGALFEMHWHNYIEMEFIISGEAEHIYNSDVRTVEHGHSYIITPHDFHAFHALSDITLINVCFDMNVLDEEITNALSLITFKNFYGIFDDESFADICKNLEAIKYEQENQQPLSNTLSKSLIYEIIINIIRISGNSITQIPSLAQKMISYVHTNFQKNISVTELSQHFSCTPNYIGKLFTKHTGITFNNYLNELRLKYACNMLRFSNLPVKDIAIMAGYSSIEYFFSVFKKNLRITPMDYRKMNDSTAGFKN